MEFAKVLNINGARKDGYLESGEWIITTKMIPPVIGNDATPDIPATAFIIMFAGIHSNNVIPIPNNPEQS